MTGHHLPKPADDQEWSVPSSNLGRSFLMRAASFKAAGFNKKMKLNLFRSLLLVPVLASATPAIAHDHDQNACIVVASADGSSSKLEVNTRDKFGKNEAITAPVFNESNGE
jgi:hypothetical protein